MNRVKLIIHEGFNGKRSLELLMKIDEFNCDIITKGEISIHDLVFKKLKFDYEKKKVSIFLLDPQIQERNIMIIYDNVLGFSMISSDFWGKSPHILDWEVAGDEEKELTKKIIQEREQYNYFVSRINDDLNYIETILTLSSGDRFRISCECIYFEEK